MTHGEAKAYLQGWNDVEEVQDHGENPVILERLRLAIRTLKGEHTSEEALK